MTITCLSFVNDPPQEAHFEILPERTTAMKGLFFFVFEVETFALEVGNGVLEVGNRVLEEGSKVLQ